MNNTLGEKIKKRRIELEMTLEEVGDLVGVTKSTVRKWETGDIENMRRDKIALLAKALKVSPLFIMGIEADNVLPLKKIDTNSYAVPLIGTIAAGTPILAEENIEEYFSLDKSINADFCLRVKGDSMIDEGIYSGDIAFIRQQFTLENGEIGAIIIEEEATLKRFYKTDGQILLQPANKDYQPIVLTNGNIHIAGKLVAVLNIRD